MRIAHRGVKSENMTALYVDLQARKIAGRLGPCLKPIIYVGKNRVELAADGEKNADDGDGDQ